ncbi:hypothetical protein RJ55_06352 [Drechmeria coniospora]|nr:hypothetical protein RJ55_06352 [Drechmeria coniospora]
MIKPDERLWSGSGVLLTGGPYTWHVTDFDQRRHFSVTYDPPTPVQDVEETEEICMAQLRKHIDSLEDDVYGISFTDVSGPITICKDWKDDVTGYVNCHPLSALEHPFAVKTIYLASLTELDRLGPQVDLVSYRGTPAVGAAPTETKAVFKYWFMENGMFRTWYELNSWSRLPRDHPHIVPFDAVVLNNITGGIVGLTSLFVPGGTLEDNNATKRRFSLEWLRQLLSVVDDLNYVYGMMHQDIAPRNLVIDQRGNLQIFDFNYSIMIDKHYTVDRDDLKGVVFTLYEMITLDKHFRDLPHEQQDAEAVLRLEWTKHPDVMLDNDVTAFRQVLEAWVKKRKGREFTMAETWVQWPWMPKPPAVLVPTYGDGRTVTGTETKSVPILIRQQLIELKQPYWKWERPASYRLRDALGEGDECQANGGVPGEVK